MVLTRIYGLVLGGLLTCACSTQSSAPLSQDVQLEQDIIALQGFSQPHLSKWRRVSEQALSLQNWPLAATSLQVLCQSEVNAINKKKACENLAVVSHLLSDDALLFDIYLTLYIHQQRQDQLENAKLLADSPERQARLAIARGDLPEKKFEKNGLPKEDLAQFYYLSGKQTNDMKDLHLAVELFEKTGLIQKQADTHFLLAKLYRNEGNIDDALGQAARSYVLLEQINNQEASEVVVRWINEHAKSR